MSHDDAIQRDARTVLSSGERRTIVIIEPNVDHRGRGLTKIEKIKTFVRPGGHTLRLGDTVEVKIVDVGDSHAEALALDVVD